LRPDGAVIYVPTFEGDFWNVVDTKSGELITRIETKSGAHNTVASRDGRFMFLGGLKSPDLFMVDCVKHELAKRIGPMGGSIRPFTIDSATKRAYVCVNGLLGFEMAEIETGKLAHRVEVAGFKSGPVKRHGCPSHGVGLTPDEREAWVVDAFNERIHVFDNTVDPPRQMQSIPVRDQPGWITFSIDGRFAYSSTGEVIETVSKRIVASLADDFERAIHSEKMIEIDFREGEPIATGDQFGVGRMNIRN
jgi:DNA-binding beta-propeller fold protein YncE